MNVQSISCCHSTVIYKLFDTTMIEHGEVSFKLKLKQIVQIFL